MLRNKCCLIFLAIFSSYGGSASNTTLQLPITINPLVQDAMQRGDLTNELIKLHGTFFENVTFSDIVKNLYHKPLPQLQKNLQSLVVLGLAAMSNGLTVEQFEFIQKSKWTITMSVEELANVSSNITLPLNDKVPVIIIQEAMFQILEKRFNFKTEEIAERFNTTKDEIYAFLEPGWIKVVNFITEKNILELSTNYTIPPFYIAEALNMSLSELYNSTLPQLEDILVNKIDIIKERSKMVSFVSSKASYLVQESTSTIMDTPTMMEISGTQDTLTTEKQSTRATLPTQSMVESGTRHMTTPGTFSTSGIVPHTSASSRNASGGRDNTEESSKMISLFSSKASYLVQESTSTIMDTPIMMEISSTRDTTRTEKQPTRATKQPSTRHMTTIEILPTQTVVESRTRHMTTPRTFSTSMSETRSSISVTERRSIAKTTRGITASIETKKFREMSLSTQSFPTFPQLTMATDHRSYVTPGSQFPKYSQAPTSQADFAVSPTSSRTGEFSTNSRQQQSANIQENSRGQTATVNPNKPTSYHATSSYHKKAAAATETLVADDVDPVVLIVIPVICVLLVATIGFYICYVDKTQKKTKRQTKTAEPFWENENAPEFFWGKENN